MANDLCSADKTQPVDATIESTWPGYLRDFKEQVLNSFLLEHICSGRHLYGTDTDGGGTNMVVDVGGMSNLAGAPYAGLLVKVLPITTNIASGTLTVKTNGTTIASGPLKFNGSNLAVGAILTGQWIECAWDGTNWQVLSGISIAAILTGFPMLLDASEADGSQLTGSTAAQALYTYALGANSYTRILVEAEIAPFNTGGTNRIVGLTIKAGATVKKQIAIINIGQVGSSGEQTPIKFSTSFAQTAAASLTVNMTWSQTGSSFGAYLVNARTWGIK